MLRKEGAPQTPRAGRKGLATRRAAPHADEWETREPTTRPGKAGHPPSLSHGTLAALFLLTIATTAAVVGKRCRLLAADPAVV